MIYVLIATSSAIISLGMLIFLVNFLRHLRDDLEATATWIRSCGIELDRQNDRLERALDNASQSG